MSELKHQLMLNKERSWVPCYIKSEADKVIAEKDTEIDGLKERIEVLNHQVCKMNCAMVKHYNEVCDDLIHHKFKRCLAMAKVCYLRFVRYENYLQKLCASNATIAAYKFRRDLYDKWEKRWLKLAEKFKEAK